MELSEEFDNLKITAFSTLVEILTRTYSGFVAVEFALVENVLAEEWLYNRFNSINTHINLSLSLKEKKK